MHFTKLKKNYIYQQSIQFSTKRRFLFFLRPIWTEIWRTEVGQMVTLRRHYTTHVKTYKEARRVFPHSSIIVQLKGQRNYCISIKLLLLYSVQLVLLYTNVLFQLIRFIVSYFFAQQSYNLFYCNKISLKFVVYNNCLITICSVWNISTSSLGLDEHNGYCLICFAVITEEGKSTIPLHKDFINFYYTITIT